VLNFVDETLEAGIASSSIHRGQRDAQWWDRPIDFERRGHCVEGVNIVARQ
jgi:hypothetical protein